MANRGKKKKISILTIEQDQEEKREEMAKRTPAERFSHLQKLQRLNKIFSSKRNYKPEDEEGIILKEK